MSQRDVNAEGLEKSFAVNVLGESQTGTKRRDNADQGDGWSWWSCDLQGSTF